MIHDPIHLVLCCVVVNHIFFFSSNPMAASPLIPLPSVAPSSNFKVYIHTYIHTYIFFFPHFLLRKLVVYYKKKQGTCGFGHKQLLRSGGISIRSSKGLRLSAGDFIIEEDDVLMTFLKDRELNGDFIAKVSDKLWMRKAIKADNTESGLRNEANQLDEPFVDENAGGFLKLTTTNDRVLGENTAPINKKMRAKQLRDDSQRRTRLNLLQYEAVKRELLYLTVGIGSACSVYCLITFSIQAAVSYATGVLFSCLYLQLLYRYVDNISREEVPQIFRQKKIKKIGIRSGDLEETFERVVKGCSMALSSPRLVIPAAIYGLWGLSQHFANDYFQLTPAMVGVFAYKAAALVQVYRDNEDLQLILPGNEEDQY